MASDEHVGTGPVAARIARIKGQLKRLEHTSAVKQGTRTKYRYTPTDDIKDVLRPMLSAEGVVIVPWDVEVLDRQRYEVEKTGDKGRYIQVTYDLMVKVRWRISAGTDNFESAASIGRSLNQDDKDPGAASTYAYRNLVAALFDLSTGEDHEQEGADAAEEARPEPEARPRRRQPADEPAEPAEEKPKRTRSTRKQTGDDTEAKRPSRRGETTSTKPISAAQVTRLQTIASKNGWPEPEMRRLYADLGVPADEDGHRSAKAIPELIYEDLVNEFSEPYPTAAIARRELNRIAEAAGLPVIEASDAVKAAIGGGLSTITGNSDLFVKALQAVTEAADKWVKEKGAPE